MQMRYLLPADDRGAMGIKFGQSKNTFANEHFGFTETEDYLETYIGGKKLQEIRYQYRK